MFAPSLNPRKGAQRDTESEQEEPEEVECPQAKKVRVEEPVRFGDLEIQENRIVIGDMKPVEYDSTDAAKHVVSALNIVDTESRKKVDYVPDVAQKLNYSQRRKSMDRLRAAMKKSDRYDKKRGTFKLSDKLAIVDPQKRQVPDRKSLPPVEDMAELKKQLAELKRLSQQQKQSDTMFTEVVPEERAELPQPANVPQAAPVASQNSSKVSDMEYAQLRAYMGL